MAKTLKPRQRSQSQGQGKARNFEAKAITSSSAVADRLRDALCVSFSSTIRRAPSFIISYFGFRFTAAYN